MKRYQLTGNRSEETIQKEVQNNMKMKNTDEEKTAQKIHRENPISISFVSQKRENEVEIFDGKIVENTIEHIKATQSHILKTQ